MSRYFVPAVFIAVISGLAFGLIVGIVARSPETHSNVHPEGYGRTPISYVGEEVPFEGIGLADPEFAATVSSLDRGRALFFGYGCASCHGLGGRGGAVGPELSWAGGLGPEELSRLLRGSPRDIPPGMPSFKIVTDEQIEELSAYLRTQFPVDYP